MEILIYNWLSFRDDGQFSKGLCTSVQSVIPTMITSKRRLVSVYFSSNLGMPTPLVCKDVHVLRCFCVDYKQHTV